MLDVSEQRISVVMYSNQQKRAFTFITKGYLKSILIHGHIDKKSLFDIAYSANKVIGYSGKLVIFGYVRSLQITPNSLTSIFSSILLTKNPRKSYKNGTHFGCIDFLQLPHYYGKMCHLRTQIIARNDTVEHGASHYQGHKERDERTSDIL